MPLPSDRVLAETRYLRLIDRDGWYFVERPHGGGVVTIVAVNDQGALVLVEQQRAPLGRPTIELPAGLVGDESGLEGESLAAAANRELLEETGYEAAEIEPIGVAATSPGMTSEMVSFFRAKGLHKRGPGGGVGDERIVVHEVPLPDVESWLAARAAAGTPISVKVYAGLYWARC